MLSDEKRKKKHFSEYKTCVLLKTKKRIKKIRKNKRKEKLL